MEGAYGAIIFGKQLGRIHTFYSITRKYTGRYGVHMVHLQKPLLEWAGNDLIKLDMKVKLNAAWCGDPNPILAQWHLFHENAFYAPLIVGGKPMGPGLSLFVIDQMEEEHRYWLKGGQVLVVELSVSFTEYIPFAAGFLSSLGVPGFPGSQFLGAGAI